MPSPDFRIDINNSRIVLSGDLLGAPDQSNELRKTLALAAQSGRASWEIDANEVRLTPEGVTVWISAVDELLRTCVLTYRPSQLAAVLQYDPRYRHESTFQDEAEPQVPISSTTAANRCPLAR